MKIGVPTEVKNNENRVSLTPAGADRLIHEGHRVLVQSGAGLGSRIGDDDYRAVGAEIVPDAETAWGEADLLIKVKEPIAQEYGFLRPDLTLFTYLHLAADRPLTAALVAAGTTAVAYETVQLPDRTLPLLTPMSEIAGRLSVTVGSYSLLSPSGGRGTLLGGIAGTPRAKTVVIGGGVAGEHAAANALGLGSKVTVIDISLPRLRELEHRYGGALETRTSSRYTIAEELLDADLVIGSVLIPGAAAPKLVTDDMVATMKPGCGAGRYCHRPGRMLRRLASDHARRPDLPRARLHLLLRGEHARGCPGDRHARPHQRHPPLCRGDCRERLGSCGRG